MSMLLAAGAAHAQERFPSKPMRVLVGFGVGSGTDVLARVVAQKMSENWGQSVIVDNRPSAGAIIASETLARSTPDGHTLAIVSLTHAFGASFYSKLPYDTLRDFAAVTLVADVPNVLVVSPASRIKSMRELIELARSKPAQMNFSSGGIGSAAHINGELFCMAAGCKAVHIPFKSMPDGLTSLIGGNIQFAFPSTTAAVPLIKSEKLVALAVSTRKRSPALPEVPPMSEAGLPDFDFSSWYGFLAPAKTPGAVKDKLSKEVARILVLPDVNQRLLFMGATARPSTPAEFDELIRREITRLAKLIKEAGIPTE